MPDRDAVAQQMLLHVSAVLELTLRRPRLTGSLLPIKSVHAAARIAFALGADCDP